MIIKSLKRKIRNDDYFEIDSEGNIHFEIEEYKSDKVVSDSFKREGQRK